MVWRVGGECKCSASFEAERGGEMLFGARREGNECDGSRVGASCIVDGYEDGEVGDECWCKILPAHVDDAHGRA